ncbi:MAG: hypothetical protein EBY61_04980 [Actinobacteria bacterium]|nr:hypothetical protein [Actinomycetota bacterium]
MALFGLKDVGVDVSAEHHGVEVDLATLPQESCVYDMLQKADSIGVFQIESRAQMATLPRLKPRTFYDLVVEVALIRPGPIQGGSVHPYIRRRNGLEPVTYLHPLLENALAKTLGVPLFQEQLMQIAIDVANFTPADADMLRQAMGSKRSRERMDDLKARFFDGMRTNGITEDIGEQIWLKLAAFSNYGFPESHSVSFSYLVYASSWIKYHYPAAFCAALLKAQPMGFWSPHTLVGDARRHGVVETSADRLPGIVTGVEAPTLPGMSPQELSHADLWATGVAPDGHPTSFIRGDLTERGVVTATDLADMASGERVLVGGVVTHRQRPATAQGTTFLNLEDETGLVNVVVSKGCWQRYKQIAKGAPALLIRGRIEKEEGVINIVADKLEPLPVGAAPASRDFR